LTFLRRWGCFRAFKRNDHDLLDSSRREPRSSTNQRGFYQKRQTGREDPGHQELVKPNSAKKEEKSEDTLFYGKKKGFDSAHVMGLGGIQFLKLFGRRPKGESRYEIRKRGGDFLQSWGKTSRWEGSALYSFKRPGKMQ